jgi:hypothetical protein
VRKVVKQVKPVPGIFSGLSEKIQNWKWTPAAMSTPEEEEERNEEQEGQLVDEPPPLPPPPLPSSSPSFSSQRSGGIGSGSGNSIRPKSATSDLSVSDASYLYPLSFEDLESVSVGSLSAKSGTSGHSQRHHLAPSFSSRPGLEPSAPAPQETSRRRHSFSADSRSGSSRRKIQLHPTIVRKRMSEDAVTPSASTSARHETDSGTERGAVGVRESRSSASDLLNASLEMLASDDFDAHYRSSPEQLPTEGAAAGRGEPRGEFSPPKTPKRGAGEGGQGGGEGRKTGSALFDIFNATPSRHYEMDFASTLEKELESFLVAHDIHEVSPPETQGQGKGQRSRDRERGVGVGFSEEREDREEYEEQEEVEEQEQVEEEEEEEDGLEFYQDHNGTPQRHQHHTQSQSQSANHSQSHSQSNNRKVSSSSHLLYSSSHLLSCPACPLFFSSLSTQLLSLSLPQPSPLPLPNDLCPALYLRLHRSLLPLLSLSLRLTSSPLL